MSTKGTWETAFPSDGALLIAVLATQALCLVAYGWDWQKEFGFAFFFAWSLRGWLDGRAEAARARLTELKEGK